MLRWFPRFQVATTCFSCSTPDLNLLVTNFIFCIHVKEPLPLANNPIAVNKYIIIIIIVMCWCLLYILFAGLFHNRGVPCHCVLHIIQHRPATSPLRSWKVSAMDSISARRTAIFPQLARFRPYLGHRNIFKKSESWLTDAKQQIRWTSQDNAT